MRTTISTDHRRHPRRRSSFLMCRPTYYRVVYEINPWMNRKIRVDHTAAISQWRSLYHTLTSTAGAAITLMRPVKESPDIVFTANAGLISGKTAIRSNFRYPQRKGEEKVFERWFRRRRYNVITLPEELHFEGEGDALYFNGQLFLGYHFRSDLVAHEKLAEILKIRILSLELVDKRFYHLDTCFCPLDEHSALYVPGAFDRYAQKVISHYVKDPIPVGITDGLRFVCNSIVIGRTIICPAGISDDINDQLSKRGFVTCEVNLSEFIKAGGAAKCLVLRLPAAR